MIKKVEEIIRMIKKKEVAGADDAALASLQVLTILAKHSKAETAKELRKEIIDVIHQLINARPSSASLRNCVLYIRREIEALDDVRLVELQNLVQVLASRFTERINEAKKTIAEIGSRRIKNGDVILTHGFSSTVLAILTRVREEGKKIHVFVTEARPDFEGREMVWRINKMGIPSTLIIDSAVRVFINEIDNVLVGAEAIAVNGSVISKIGTAVIATLAREARVRTLVAVGTYKLSPETVVGELVEMEEGDQTKVLDLILLPKMKNVKVRNPLYDVTPPQYIDAIITEKGIMPPQSAYLMLKQMMES